MDGEPREPADGGPGGPAPWYLGGGSPPATAPGPPAPVPGPVPPAPAPAAPKAWPAVDVDPAPSPGVPWEPAADEAGQQRTWTAAWPAVPPTPPGVPASVSPRRTGLARPTTAIMIAIVVVLVAVGSYVVVRATSSSEEAGSTPDSGIGSPAQGAAQGSGGDTGTVIDPARVGPLQPVSVRATCQAEPGVDSAGKTITYEPDLTLDAVPATAWRCPGSAVGHQLVYDFGAPVTLTSVALVPGYAKVDPVDGTDRFVENRTVTAVAWRFDDGTTHRQTIGSPGPGIVNADLPRGVSTREVVLEIADTGNDGAVRDFTAVSDVRFAGY